MRKLIATVFIATSLFAAPGVAITSASAQDCTPGATGPAMRPGGFCDQIAGTGSLSLPGSSNSCTDYRSVSMTTQMVAGERIHVAETCLVTCARGSSLDVRKLQIGDRVRVAASSPEEACEN